MAEGPVTVGEVTACVVIDVRAAVVRVRVRGVVGQIRGSAAGRIAVGDHLHIRVTEVDASGRFVAVILHE